MRSVRRPDEWHDLLNRAKLDREKRVIDGKSAIADRAQILLPDRQSAEFAATARRANPAAVNELPLEFIDDTLSFHPEWVVDKIAPRPILFITTDDDRLVPPEESEALFAKAGEPKKARDIARLWSLPGLCRACLQSGDGGNHRLVPHAPRARLTPWALDPSRRVLARADAALRNRARACHDFPAMHALRASPDLLMA